jgi:predicted transcriptional regulator
MDGRRSPGSLEQEVLAALAAADRALTPGEVRDVLGAELAYTTVMTVLDELLLGELLQHAAEDTGGDVGDEGVR